MATPAPARRRPDRMSDSDAILWTLDRDPLLRSTIVAVVVLDRPPGLPPVLEKMRILCRERRRFRSVVAAGRLPWDRPSWREVPNFDPAVHVMHVRAPEPGGLQDVLDLAESVGARAFDAARPLWEVVLVDGMEGTSAALIVKVHHSVIDGVGGLSVLASILDTERERPRTAHAVEEPEPHRARSRRGRHALPLDLLRREAAHLSHQIRTPLRHVVAQPRQSVERWLSTAADSVALVSPTPAPCSSLMGDRGLDRHFGAVHVCGDLRQAAATAGLTLNDLFVSGLLRGLSLYHRRHDHPVEDLRVVMPVSTRRAGDPLETNRFVPVRMTLPADLATARAYLTEVPARLSRWKRSGAIALDELLTAALQLLPDAVLVWTFASMLKGVDFVATDVPGPPGELYLGGAKVESVFAFAPTSGAALNASLVSTAGRPNIAVSVDTAAVPDPALLVRCLEQGLEELISAAEGRSEVPTPGLGGRRPPPTVTRETTQ